MEWFSEENRVVVLSGLITAVIIMTICTNIGVRKLQRSIGAGGADTAVVQTDGNKELSTEDEWYYLEDTEYMEELDSLVSTLAVSQALLEKVYPERYNYVSSVLWESRFVTDRQSKVLFSDEAYRNYSDYFFIMLSNQSNLDYMAAKSDYHEELQFLSGLTMEGTLEEMSYEQDGYERFILKERLDQMPTIEHRRVFRNEWGRDTLLYVMSQPNNRKTTVILDMYTNGTIHSYLQITD